VVKPKFDGPRPFEASSGPYEGVRDQVDAKPGPPGELAAALNVYRDSEAEAHWRTRPAWTKLAATQLGQALSRVGQCVFQHTRLDGTEYSYLFAGGRLYEYLWATAEYIDRTPTAGGNAPGGFTIHQTNRIYCLTFNDYMIVTDGANRPWKWNAATRQATYLTDLAKAIYGKMWVYNATLWGILDTERNVAVWSEILNPDVGYENPAYNNRWILGQTSQEQIEGAEATNTQIYALRNTTGLGISGAVTEEFQTQGTVDDYPQGMAFGAAATMLRHEQHIYFVDEQFRPFRIEPGDIFTPFWGDAWKTVDGFEVSDGPRASAVIVPDLELIAFAIPTKEEKAASAERPKSLYVFNMHTGRYMGVWQHASGASFRAMGVLKDSTRRYRTVFLDEAGYARVLELGVTAGTVDDGVVAIPWQVDLPRIGEGGKIEVTLDLVELYGRSGARVPAELDYEDHQGMRPTPMAVELGYVEEVGLDWVSLFLAPRLKGSSTKERLGFIGAKFTGSAAEAPVEVR
jgi:hypothetical protein